MELWEYSASELSRMMAARKVAPSEVMAAFLGRIEAVNPRLNAIVSLRDPDELMAEARAADDAATRRGLHGLPMAVKDLVATKGLRTTWGSPLFADFVPAKDDLLAARMRAAGAIFIGKTNVPEWGQGSHTFNPVFGATKNPYDRGRSAGGSSGGAAAGLAARMLPVADGSDMMGSLRNPAAFCNVYGFRPSFGLVPGDAEGERFLSTLSTAGPMGRTVEDVARLLCVQAGENPEVPFGRPVDNFSAALRGASLKGRRIGWLGDWGGAYAMEPGILDLCASGLEEMRALGAEVEEIAPPFPAEEIWRSWTQLRAMLSANRYRALWEDPAKRAMVKPETQWEIEQGLGLSAPRHLRGERDPQPLVCDGGAAFHPVRRARAALGAGLAVPGRLALAAGDRRAEDGHLSPLDGGGGPGLADRPASAVAAYGVRRGGPADGAAVGRPRGGGCGGPRDGRGLAPGDRLAGPSPARAGLRPALG